MQHVAWCKHLGMLHREGPVADHAAAFCVDQSHAQTRFDVLARSDDIGALVVEEIDPVLEIARIQGMAVQRVERLDFHARIERGARINRRDLIARNDQHAQSPMISR